ncbi:hypothetical protein PTKU15_92750 [Paraburkholderia terrae]|nr:hypothetical protein PTKU15_92750 [Paraburkholderia terrae]
MRPQGFSQPDGFHPIDLKDIFRAHGHMHEKDEHPVQDVVLTEPAGGVHPAMQDADDKYGTVLQAIEDKMCARLEAFV